jgi:hypothetical protein
LEGTDYRYNCRTRDFELLRRRVPPQRTDDDLVLRPIDVLVLDAQHLALPAAGLDRPDDSVVHRGSDPLVPGRVHRDACGKELLLLVSMDSTALSFRLGRR